MIENSSDYDQTICQLIREAAGDFTKAAGNIEGQRRACCRFFKRGRIAGVSHAELIDFLGISTPSVLDKAGYSVEDAQRVMNDLANISDNEIEEIEI